MTRSHADRGACGSPPSAWLRCRKFMLTTSQTSKAAKSKCAVSNRCFTLLRGCWRALRARRNSTPRHSVNPRTVIACIILYRSSEVGGTERRVLKHSALWSRAFYGACLAEPLFRCGLLLCPRARNDAAGGDVTSTTSISRRTSDSLLLRSCAAAQRTGFANSFSESVLFGEYAVPLADFGPGTQFEYPGQGNPGLGIGFRVVDPQSEVYGVSIHPLVAFFQAHGLAVGKAGCAQPRAVVVAGGLDNESGIVHPLAGRVSVPKRIGIVGEFAAVGPDLADHVITLKHLQNAVRELREFEGRGEIQNAWKAHWIALEDGIVSAGRGSFSIAGLLEVIASFGPSR